MATSHRRTALEMLGDNQYGVAIVHAELETAAQVERIADMLQSYIPLMNMIRLAIADHLEGRKKGK